MAAVGSSWRKVRWVTTPSWSGGRRASSSWARTAIRRAWVFVSRCTATGRKIRGGCRPPVVLRLTAPGEPRPQVTEHLLGGPMDGPGEGEGSGGEDLCAMPRLVVGHVRRQAGAVEVRDLGDHLHRARRGGDEVVGLDPAARER